MIYTSCVGAIVGFMAASSICRGAGAADSKEEAEKPLRLVIIGDSLTAGYGVSKADAFPAQLQNIINESGDLKRQIKVVAAGISGSTSASLKKRLAWQMKLKPDAIMFAIGANDGLRGLEPEQMKSNLLDAIKTSEQAGVKVILAGMKMPMNYGQAYRAKYEAVYSELGQLPGLIYIPFLLKDVGGVKELNQSDAIHPNEKGHTKMAENLWAQLKEEKFFKALRAKPEMKIPSGAEFKTKRNQMVSELVQSR